jgi:hypothetical protein
MKAIICTTYLEEKIWVKILIFGYEKNVWIRIRPQKMFGSEFDKKNLHNTGHTRKLSNRVLYPDWILIQ